MKLKEIGRKKMIFRSRFKCLRAVKQFLEDYFTYTGKKNMLIQKIDYAKMTEHSLQATGVEKLTIDKLAFKSKRVAFVNLKADNQAIEKASKKKVLTCWVAVTITISKNAHPRKLLQCLIQERSQGWLLQSYVSEGGKLYGKEIH